MFALLIAACCIPTGPTTEEASTRAPPAEAPAEATAAAPQGPPVQVEEAPPPLTDVTLIRTPERWQDDPPEGGPEELAACAASDDWRAQECLLALAAVDNPRAVALAKAKGPDDHTAAGVVRYSPPGTLPKALQAAGLLAEGDAVPDASFDPVDTLVAAGRVHWFDVETGMYPNEHDVLLAELAYLARPDLDGAVFREDADPWQQDVELSDYVLHGWHGGRHFTTTADVDLGDWYDIAATLALLDAMLEAAGSDKRAHALYTGDQTLPVLVAPTAATERGVAAGLLRPGDTRSPRQVGTAAEEAVFRALLEQGEDVRRDVVIPVE